MEGVTGGGSDRGEGVMGGRSDIEGNMTNIPHAEPRLPQVSWSASV